MNLGEFDVSQACESRLVANTPLFLIRKLRTDPVVQDIALRFASSEIVNALKVSLQADPRTFEDGVWPYVLVTALFLKGDVLPLQEAAELTSPNLKWYKCIAAALLADSKPLNFVTIDVPQKISQLHSEPQSAGTNVIVIPSARLTLGLT
jgi:hypothetical protein